MSDNNDRGEPGLSYPEDIPHDVPTSVHKAVRMIVDNLYFLKKQVGQTAVVPAASMDSQPAETPKANDGQSNVPGSTSGYATFSQPIRDKNYKKVVIYADALLGTATYKFPSSFVKTPQILSQTLAAIVSSLTATSVTLTGATSTGFIELSGY